MLQQHRRDALKTAALRSPSLPVVTEESPARSVKSLGKLKVTEKHGGIMPEDRLDHQIFMRHVCLLLNSLSITIGKNIAFMSHEYLQPKQAQILVSIRNGDFVREPGISGAQLTYRLAGNWNLGKNSTTCSDIQSVGILYTRVKD